MCILTSRNSFQIGIGSSNQIKTRFFTIFLLIRIIPQNSHNNPVKMTASISLVGQMFEKCFFLNFLGKVFFCESFPLYPPFLYIHRLTFYIYQAFSVVVFFQRLNHKYGIVIELIVCSIHMYVQYVKESNIGGIVFVAYIKNIFIQMFVCLSERYQQS